MEVLALSLLGGAALDVVPIITTMTPAAMIPAATVPKMARVSQLCVGGILHVGEEL